MNTQIMNEALRTHGRQLVAHLLGPRALTPSTLWTLVDLLPANGLHDGDALVRLAIALQRERAACTPDGAGEKRMAPEHPHSYAADAERVRIGLLGEDYVVRACRERLQVIGHSELALQVEHVAVQSDALGYDVACPLPGGRRRLLEVKTTAATARGIQVHVSRNEADVGAANADWRLVVCLLAGGDQVRETLWFHYADIADALPIDAGSRGRWADAVIRVDARGRRGLPGLGR